MFRSTLRLGFSLLSLSGLLGCAGDSSEWLPLQEGDPAPLYRAVTLSGDSVSLTEFRGEVVLLNVWATDCLPCVHELPVLQQLHDRYAGDGLRMIGLGVDHHSKPSTEIQAFLDQRGVTYLNLRDDLREVTRTFRWPAGIPRTVLIDREGRVVRHWAGGWYRLTPSIEHPIRTTLGYVDQPPQQTGAQ